MTLPTIDELAPPPSGWHRDTDDLLRLSLVSRDDGELRARAIALFRQEETLGNTPGGGSAGAYTNAVSDMSSVPARTPGGIAWKIATALDHWKDEESWEWWRYLLQSALSDAIEHERRRLSRSQAGPDVALWLTDRWSALRRQHAAMPEILGDEANEAERDRLCNEWIAICRLLSGAPATSAAGVLGKLRVLAAEIEAGKAADGRDMRLCESIAADVERLGVGVGTAASSAR